MPILVSPLRVSSIAASALISLGSISFSAEESEQSLTSVNNAAHFLAGLELPHPGAEKLAASQSFTSHRAALDREWKEHEERALAPMRTWSVREVSPNSKQGGVVRYMFSGPDILHALSMFPKADTFVLCGLEPVGVAPDIGDITTANAGRVLGEVRNALGEIINFSFFRTNDMKTDLKFATFRGTTPLMMVFLARSGHSVRSYEFLKLQKDGSLESRGSESGGADVVKIEFAPSADSKTKTLYYFSTDLSNGGFPKNGFATWLAAQPKGDSYLKAASFLMHNAWFGGIRDHLLEYSDQIVQDDSGIPYRQFAKDKWDAHLYGVYSGPIELFAEHYQKDLRAAYQAGATAIDFGTGYKWRKGQSNLMRFVARGAKGKSAPDADPAP